MGQFLFWTLSSKLKINPWPSSPHLPRSCWPSHSPRSPRVCWPWNSPFKYRHDGLTHCPVWILKHKSADRLQKTLPFLDLIFRRGWIFFIALTWCLYSLAFKWISIRFCFIYRPRIGKISDLLIGYTFSVNFTFFIYIWYLDYVV